MEAWFVAVVALALTMPIFCLLLILYRNKRITARRLAQEAEERARIEAERQRQRELEEKKRKEELTRKREQAERREREEREKIKAHEAEMEAKGLIRIFRHDRYVWVNPEEKKALDHLEADMRYNFPDMDDDAFAGFVQNLFTKLGYSVSSGGEPGRFLIKNPGEKSLVAVYKRERDDLLSRDDVAAAVESLPGTGVDRLYLVTTSSYTPEARDYAKTVATAATFSDSTPGGERIILWDFQRLYELVDRCYLGKLTK